MENKLKNLLEIVADEFKTSPEDIISKNRSSPLPDARAQFYLAAKSSFEWKETTDLKLAKFMGRNRTTVLSSVRVGKNLLETEEDFRVRQERIKSKIR